MDPVQVRMAHVDGSWRDVEAVITNLRDEPSVAGYVANLRDISDRKEAEARLVHQALHDPLTGLPNRTVILDSTERLLARSKENLEPQPPCSSTSTISKTSTTLLATRQVTTSYRRSVNVSWPLFAGATELEDSGAMSSLSWPKVRPWAWAQSFWPNGYSTSCASRSASRASR